MSRPVPLRAARVVYRLMSHLSQTRTYRMVNQLLLNGEINNG